MEPSLIGWEWPLGRLCSGMRGHGRNGAQPYRLGMAHSAGSLNSAVQAPPQWSPALSAGNGGRCNPSPTVRHKAAMEPSLIGWEWPHSPAGSRSTDAAAMEPSLIGWEWQIASDLSSASDSSRNGAQPYRLGMGGRSMWSPDRKTSRNGAQPYRLGMARLA